jgi:hypothetical protein
MLNIHVKNLRLRLCTWLPVYSEPGGEALSGIIGKLRPRGSRQWHSRLSQIHVRSKPCAECLAIPELPAYTVTTAMESALGRTKPNRVPADEHNGQS